MKTFKLNNGIDIPVVGFGVFQITDYQQCVSSVKNAIDVGYRLIDTAQSYGNEEAVGEGIIQSKINRSELFITTKIWVSNTGYTKAKQSILDSLKRMKLDYLDLVLIHQPYGDVYGTYQAMIDLHNEGLIRSIGVSNFYPDRITDISLFADLIPAINQIEVNPFHQQILAQSINQKFGVQVQAWAPFAEGMQNMFTNPTLLEIAKHHNKSVAQVILRWLYQRGIVSLAKTINKERMIENINIFDFELSDDSMKLIQALDLKTSSFFDHATPEAVERIASLRRKV